MGGDCKVGRAASNGLIRCRVRVLGTDTASATARRRERLAVLIEWIFDDSDQTYGHRRIHAALARQGERCSPELVRAIMRELGLVACQPRPFRPVTTVAGDTPPAPDLLGGDFCADAPGAKLVGDIT